MDEIVVIYPPLGDRKGRIKQSTSRQHRYFGRCQLI